MAHKVTYLPGDGIGPEVVEATIEVVDATGVKIQWERGEAGAEVEAREGTNLPTATLEQIIRNDAALKGPTATAVGTSTRDLLSVLFIPTTTARSNYRPEGVP